MSLEGLVFSHGSIPLNWIPPFHQVVPSPLHSTVRLSTSGLRDYIPPVKNRPRRIPHTMKQAIESKLAEMEKAGIIARVDTPTDWISNSGVARGAVAPGAELRGALKSWGKKFFL